MSIDYPAHDSMSLEEVTISHMLEMVAIVNVLEQKGLCTKQTSRISSPNRQEESVGADLEMGQRVEKGTTYRQRGCYGIKLPAAAYSAEAATSATKARSYGGLGEAGSMQIN